MASNSEKALWPKTSPCLSPSMAMNRSVFVMKYRFSHTNEALNRYAPLASIFLCDVAFQCRYSRRHFFASVRAIILVAILCVACAVINVAISVYL